MKFLVISLLMASTGQASTFVGNGGNSGDLELQNALTQIRETFKIIGNNSDQQGPLCTCVGSFIGRPVCDSLTKLTSEQQVFCSAFMRKQSAVLGEFLNDQRESRFTWTHDQIEVKENNHLRAADAVANPRTGQITMNQERFLQMKPYERTFLLTHEILHLLHWEKKNILDEEQIGPFDSEDGGRQLLNAVAAATVVRASEEGVTQKYGSALKRSQGHKRWWFSLSGYTASTGENKQSLFAMDNTNGLQLGFRYFFWENLGLAVELRGGKTSKTVLDTIELSETQSAFAVGLSYRFFPFRDPLTYMGQSHLILDAKIENLKTDYTLSESPLNLQDSASSTALTMACNYYMPIYRGFWYFAGFGYLTHRYQYEKIVSSSGRLEANQNQSLFNTGVSYGF